MGAVAGAGVVCGARGGARVAVGAVRVREAQDGTLRPPFCIVEECQPRAVNATAFQIAQGQSLFCLGELAQPEVWTARQTEHRNDICFCCYTPFKGWIRFVMNEGDLEIVAFLIRRFVEKTGRKVRRVNAS